MGYQPRRSSDLYTGTQTARPEYQTFTAVVTSFCTKHGRVYLKEARDDAQKPLEFKLKMQLPRRMRVHKRGEPIRFGPRGDTFSQEISWRVGMMLMVLASPFADDDKYHYAVAFTTVTEFRRSVREIANPEFLRKRKWFRLRRS